MKQHMNADKLERRLQRQSIRDIPAEWRTQILSTAAAAAGSTRNHHLRSVLTVFVRLRNQIVSLLWPSPKVWASLAAIWLLLAGANRAMFNPTEPSAISGPRPVAGSVATWKEQARILAELMQPAEPANAERSIPAKPLPRSQLTSRLRMS